MTQKKDIASCISQCFCFAFWEQSSMYIIRTGIAFLKFLIKGRFLQIFDYQILVSFLKKKFNFFEKKLKKNLHSLKKRYTFASLLKKRARFLSSAG